MFIEVPGIRMPNKFEEVRAADDVEPGIGEDCLQRLGAAGNSGGKGAVVAPQERVRDI